MVPRHVKHSQVLALPRRPSSISLTLTVLARLKWTNSKPGLRGFRAGNPMEILLQMADISYI